MFEALDQTVDKFFSDAEQFIEILKEKEKEA